MIFQPSSERSRRGKDYFSFVSIDLWWRGRDACFAAGRYVGVSIPISYSDQAGRSGMVRQEIMAVQVAKEPSADGLAVVLELLMAKLQELCLAELELCAPVARMLRDVYATCS